MSCGTDACLRHTHDIAAPRGSPPSRVRGSAMLTTESQNAEDRPRTQFVVLAPPATDAARSRTARAIVSTSTSGTVPSSSPMSHVRGFSAASWKVHARSHQRCAKSARSASCATSVVNMKRP